MHMLDTWQHASGMTKPLLQYPQRRAPHLEGVFYNHVRAFIAKHNMSLEIAGISEAIPPKTEDWAIMDVACSDESFSDNEVRKIYYCKSFLQVRWMSDLISGDEQELIYGIRYGFRGTKQSVSKYEEILQEQPSESK